MAIIPPAAPVANIPGSTRESDPYMVVHGDCFPDGNCFYCIDCDVFWPADHFVTVPRPYSFSRHTANDNLARYFATLNYRGRTLRRKFNPQHNFFTSLVFHGREPSREEARTLGRLILRESPISTTNLKTRDLVDAAVAVDRYRRVIGDL